MKHRFRHALSLTLALAACGMVLSSHAHDDAPPGDFDLQKALVDARQATRRFNDVDVAIAANYVKFPDLAGDCVAQAGQGGMGVHYLNGALVDGELDPLQPELLVYRPNDTGQLALAALEYVVPAPVWDAAHAQPPSLFGHAFHLLRVPNRYGLETPLYTLHVWLWEHNPNGLFNDWNPNVHCD